eukprot:250435-Pelagomonas_calceolata.AAC.1
MQGKWTQALEKLSMVQHGSMSATTLTLLIPHLRSRNWAQANRERTRNEMSKPNRKSEPNISTHAY